ncbi:MAG: D-fructose 1,6-bisphosphatase [bacterium]|nr:D-fructose 1,6-bisphosphatase [bacterium]
MTRATTLARFVMERSRTRVIDDELARLLVDLTSVIPSISAAVAHGAVGGRWRETLLDACASTRTLAGVASHGVDDVYRVPSTRPPGKYLVALHLLDGSSNLPLNQMVGSTLSITRRPAGDDLAPSDFLQRGTRQVCAGYALYGRTTMLVLTLGRRVRGFTFDGATGEFVLTHPDLRIPESTNRIAIDGSNSRFWEPPIKRYIDECAAGAAGPRGADFNMGWSGSLVAEVHHILLRGGVLVCPRDSRERQSQACVRLLYEAAPLALLVERAGGASSTGSTPLLHLSPQELHEHVPVILGSLLEVQRMVRYHREHALGTDEPYSSPLFGTRSLFRQP